MANVLQWNSSTNSFSVSGASSVTQVVGEGIDNNFSVPQTFGAGILQTGAAGTGNQSPLLNVGDAFSDFIASGVQWAIPSSASLTTSMTSGSAYLNSVRTLVPAISGNAFPASNDTYVSFNNSGVPAYQSVANGATAPTPTSGYVQTAKVVTSPIQSPAATLSTSTSGSLASGTYGIALVAFDATGYGAVGASGTVAVTSAQSGSGSIELSWVNPLNETSMDIYATTAGGTTLGLVASGVTGTSYTYTGSVAPGAAAPTTATSNAVQTVLPLLRFYPKQQNSNFNVLAFGADPTGVNDSTESIQNALNAAATLAELMTYSGVGGVSFYTAPKVIFPHGTYLVSSQLTVNKYVQLVTEGVASIVTSMASGYLIQIAGAGGAFTQHQMYRLFSGDLHLVNTNSANTAAALLLGGTTATNGDCYEAEINSVFISGFNNSHVYGNNCWGINWVGCTFTAGTNNAGASPIQTLSAVSNSGERLTYIGCVFGNNATAVFNNVLAGLEYTFLGCSFDYNAGTANFFYSVNNATGHVIRCVGCHFEWNTASSFLAAVGASTTPQYVYISITQSWILFTGTTAMTALFIFGAPDTNAVIKNNVYGSASVIPSFYQWGPDTTSGTWDVDDPALVNMSSGSYTSYFEGSPPGGTLVTQRIVPPATGSNQAVQLGQVSIVAPQTFSYSGGTAASTTYGQTLTFTAPTAGYMKVAASFNNDSTAALGASVELLVNGASVAQDSAAVNWTLYGFAAVAAGSVTVTAQYTVGGTALANAIDIRGLAEFVANP